MAKPDELELLKRIRWGETPEVAQILMGMPWKRLLYILNKWAVKGWWDFGVHPTRGWFTDTAP